METQAVFSRRKGEGWPWMAKACITITTHPTMKLNNSELENAFFFVSMAPRFMNTAILSNETGEVYYLSEMGDSDEPQNFTEFHRKIP
jgi:hypothetical protein